MTMSLMHGTIFCGTEKELKVIDKNRVYLSSDSLFHEDCFQFKNRFLLELTVENHHIAIQFDLKLSSTEWRRILKFGDPVVYRKTNESAAKIRIAESFGLQIPYDIGWRDSKHGNYPVEAAKECVRVGLCKSYYYQGRSSIVSRNSIYLDDVKTDEFLAESFIGDLEYPNTEVKYVGKEKIHYVSKDTENACYNIYNNLERDRADDLVRELFLESDCDVLNITEFNKTLYNKRRDFQKYVELVSRSTSCGNQTVLFVHVPKSGHVRCPNDLKGLLIGRGGCNIKRLSDICKQHIKLV